MITLSALMAAYPLASAASNTAPPNAPLRIDSDIAPKKGDTRAASDTMRVSIDEAFTRIRSNGYDASPAERMELSALLTASLASAPRGDDERMRIAFIAGNRFTILRDISNALTWYTDAMTAAGRIVSALPTPSDVLMLGTGSILTNALILFADDIFIANSYGTPLMSFEQWPLLTNTVRIVARELDTVDEVRYASGVIHYVAADHAAALHDFTAIRQERFPSLPLYRALIDLSLGRFQESFRAFGRISERHDMSVLAHNHAVAQLHAGRTNEALAALIRAHRGKPSSPLIAYNIGALYQHRSDMQKAAYYYTRAYDTDNRYSPAAYALGLISMEIEDYPRALAHFTAVESNGQSSALVSRVPLYNNIAYCLMRTVPPQHERALQYADRAVTESAAATNATNGTLPVHAAVLDTKADVLAALGRYADAAAVLAAAAAVLTNVHSTPSIQGDIDDYQRKQKQYRAQTNR